VHLLKGRGRNTGSRKGARESFLLWKKRGLCLPAREGKKREHEDLSTGENEEGTSRKKGGEVNSISLLRRRRHI